MRTKEPGALENYIRYDVDGIRIYLFKEAKVREKIEIKMSDYVSDLPNKEIAVEGINLSDD